MANIDKPYKTLIDNIGTTLRQRRDNAVKAVNQELIAANWELQSNHEHNSENIKVVSKSGNILLNLSKVEKRQPITGVLFFPTYRKI